MVWPAYPVCTAIVATVIVSGQVNRVWLNRCILEVGEMSFLKTGVAALLGFVLGVALYHPNSARAAGNVYVQQVPVGTYNPIRGSNVVGFSCAGSGTNTACYIASQ